ncbi:MAG: hypothetical protein K0S56_737 [Microvirga sp.]|jgi:hypothetical protein|nr:hypothetical protein [Microvirga sp.]
MTRRTCFRILSGSGVPWRGRRRRTETTTARGQDKRAHIARRSGCWFCTSFLRLRHLVEPNLKVCACRKCLRVNDFLHIAELRHER